MKKNIGFIVSCLFAGLCFTACNNDAIDDLRGVYSDMLICNSKEATVLPTTKLHQGVKSLNLSLKDAQSNEIDINFGSTEWILPPATYTVAKDVANKTCVVKVNNVTMQSGDIDVSIIGGKYYISGLFNTFEGERVKLDYSGELTFEIGIDDPEASGYTMTITTSPVSSFDWNTGQTTIYPDVTKYTLTIKNPLGDTAASLEAVNGNNLDAPNLAGTYTIQGGSTAPWLMDNGYAIPAYGAFGGSFYVDEAGNKQYIASGNISITTAQDSEGTNLYSISGSDLGTVDATGAEGKGAFNIKFASLQ